MMKTKKKRRCLHRVWAGILAVVMIVSSVQFGELEVSADDSGTSTGIYDSWTDAAEAAKPTEGEDKGDYTLDTTEKTLQIHTALGLAWFAYDVNETNYRGDYAGYKVTLTDDINLADVDVSNYTEAGIAENGDNSWTPIGKDSTEPFVGTFDGNNKTVSGVYINSTDENQGLFGRLSTTVSGDETSSVTIENLIISDVSISGSAYVGGLAGYVGIGASISNVTVKDAEITGTGDYVAGAIGYVSGASTITDVEVTGTTITGNNYMGGVVGYITTLESSNTELDAYTSITGCESNATITSTEQVQTNKVGGIIGGSNVDQVSTGHDVDLLISNCVFSGTITKDSSANYVTDSGETGGIVGDVGGTGVGKVTHILSCYNTGTIEGNSWVGGIAGSTSYATIDQCYNTGSITAKSTDSGGIVGQVGNSTITDCYNTGTITSTASSEGGIVGDISNSTTVELKNCYSIGKIENNNTNVFSVGCIVGTYTNTNASITNCYYNTEITTVKGVGTYVDESDISGIVGLTTLEMTGTTDGDDTESDTNRAQDSMTGLVDTIWTFKEDSTVVITTESYYPVLTANEQEPAPSTTSVADVTTWTEAASLAVSGTDYVLDETAQTLEIYTSTGLAYFAAMVNDDNEDTTYSDYTVSLEKDIDLDDGTVIGYGKDGTDVIGTVNWIPIADTGENQFKGTFDGQGYTISGIYITSTENFQGLFGDIANATIQNVGIINSSITGNSYVGAIAGYAYNTEIINCYNTGTITGTSSSSTHVGGIAGQIYASSSITACYNTGTVSGDENTGGIVGYIADTTTVKDSYNTGTITGDNRIGGIVGWNMGSVTTCYNIGEVTNPIVGALGASYGSVTNCYYNSGDYDSGYEANYGTGLTTLGMTGTTDNDSEDTDTNRAQDSMTGFDVKNSDGSATWTFTPDDTDGTATMTCYYPVLTSNMQEPKPSGTGTATIIANWAVAVNSANENDNIDYVIDTGAKTLKIYTVYGLAWFAAQVNAAYPNNETYYGYTVTLMNDIDLTDANVAGYNAKDIAAGGSNSWTAIGIDSRYSFQGEFDGNEKTISGVYINSTSSNQGLFGYIKNATIQNLTLSDSQISGSVSTGGIVGNASGGKIINCTTTSSVIVNSTSYRAGGIVGYASSATITNCINNAVVTGTYYVGGIAGQMDDGSMTNCMNTGTITATNSDDEYVSGAGGIAGYTQGDTSVSECTNSGTIEGEDKNVGGIVGYAVAYYDPSENTYFTTIITSNINSGAVTGSGYVGGIVGQAYNAQGNITISGNTNTGDITATTTTGDSYAGGIVGCTNQDVILGTVTNNEDDTTIYNTNTGNVTGDGNYVGGIAGYYKISSDCSIEGIENTGTISGADYVGGLIGYIYDYSSYGTITIDVSANTGNVLGSSNVGGIIGYTNTPTNVSDSYNTGAITATGNYVGGILGVTSSKYYSTTANVLSIANCYNTGIITGASHVAGILGANGESTNYNVSITDCYNVGAIIGTSNSPSTGGIAVMAQITGTTYISTTNCYYNSELSGVSVGIGNYNYTGENDGTTALTTTEMTGTLAADDGDNAGNQMTFSDSDSDGNSDWNYTANTIVDEVPYYYYPTLVANEQDPAPYTSKFPASITVSMYGWTYGDTASNPSYEQTKGDGTEITYDYYSDAACKTEISKPSDAGTYYVTATVGMTDKYLETTSEAVEFTIAPLSVVVSWVADESYTYTGSTLITPTASIAGAYSEGTIDLSVREEDSKTFQDASTYNFIASTADTNYTLTNTTQSITVSKASNSISGLSITAWTYGEYTDANAPSATADFGSITYTYSASEEENYSSTVPTSAGTYNVKASVAETDNYAGAYATQTFDIDQKNLTNDSGVSLSAIDAVTYTGSAITPEPTVTYGSGDAMITLVKGTDYTLAYESNTSAGTANVTVTFKGNYLGTASTTFTINAQSIAGYIVSDITDQTYTGKAIEPVVTVKTGTGDDATTLTLGTDYTVGYSANTNVGATDTATVTITGTGNYTGTLKTNFTIIQATPSVTVEASEDTGLVALITKVINTITFGILGDHEDAYTITATVTGVNDEKPTGTVTIMNGDETIASDLTVTNGKATYSWEEVTAADYTLTAVFTSDDDNYTDAISSPVGYTIEKATPTVTAPTANTLTYTGEAQELVSAGSTTGGTLKYSLDNVTYSEEIPTATNADTYKVYYKVEGNTNYNDVGATYVEVTIGKIAIADRDFIFDFDDLVYTGSAITPVTSILADTDYTISYENHINAGVDTATVTIKGTGNYAGTITKTFTIDQKQLTVSGSTVSDKIYDGGTTGTVTIGTVSGMEGTDTFDDLGISAMGTFASENVGIGIEVSVAYRVTNTNYIAPVTETVTADIAARQLTISGTVVEGKNYDGTTAATVTVVGTLANYIEDEEVSVSATGTFDTKNVGTSKAVIVEYSIEDSNYIAPVDSTVYANITTETITVTPDSSQSKYYGQADGTFTYTYSDGVGEEVVSFTGTLTRVSGESAGTYAITIGSETGSLALADDSKTGFLASNYSLVLDETSVTYEVKGYTTTEVATGTSDWTNTTTLILTAPTGYSISGSDVLTGNTWSDTLTITTTQAAGATATYYLLATSGDDKDAITTAMTFTYSNDQVVPTGDIVIKENSIKSLINTITYNLFFKNTVDVQITCGDDLSGVATVEYQKVATEADYDATNGTWVEDGSFSVTANDQFIVYARITDEAGNVTIIYSDGVTVYTDSEQDTESFDFVKSSDDEAKTVAVTLNGNTIAGITLKGEALVYGIENDYTVDGSQITFTSSYLETLTAGANEFIISYYPMGIDNSEATEESDTPSTTVVTANIYEVITDTTNLEQEAVYIGSEQSPTNEPTGVVVGDETLVIKYQDEEGNYTLTEIPSFTGIGIYTICYELSANNHIATTGIITFQITKADSTIQMDSITSTTYENDIILTAKVSGVNGEVPTGTVTFYNDEAKLATVPVTENGIATYTMEALATNTYSIIADFMSTDMNYKDSETLSATEFDITKANQTIAIEEVVGFTYGDSEFDLVVSGMKEDASLSYTVTSGSAVSVDSNGTITIIGAGTVTITVIAGTTENYNSDTEVVTFTVAQKEITVTPDSNQGKYYGETDGTLTYDYTGNVEGDSPSFTGLLSRESGENIASYDITLGSLGLSETESNYYITLSDTVAYTINEYITTASVTALTDWINADTVTLTAPTGYTISTSPTGTFTSFVTVDTIEGENCEVTYYLRNVDGATTTTGKVFTYNNTTTTAPLTDDSANGMGWLLLVIAASLGTISLTADKKRMKK